MKTTNIIRVNNAQSNQRIDKFLADFYSKTSRASWQKRIKNEEILVNDRKLKPDYILKKGDKINILEIQPMLPEKNIENKVPEIKIIYEDDNVIVIDKPAGILSQKASSSKTPCITDFLIKYFPKIEKVGENEQRYGIVHRLDKDTSGVMIVAKNNESFEFLKEQFKNRKTQKKYITLVYGIVAPKEGTINLKIGRSKTNPLMQTVIDSKKKEDIKSREAITNYKTIESFKNYSLLEVSPKTGRMHQIRVHLKSLGFPVVGDKKYFFKKYRNSKIEPERQFLHANKLKISLIDGNVSTFESKLPKDLKNFLLGIDHLD
ncbi:MAG: RluA family pseudouridine synthase [Patescibacteria group bacterium]|nr:RluA family pseudouridine synthase [Patescibacteria group bacterium]